MLSKKKELKQKIKEKKDKKRELKESKEVKDKKLAVQKALEEV